MKTLLISAALTAMALTANTLTASAQDDAQNLKHLSHTGTYFATGVEAEVSTQRINSGLNLMVGYRPSPRFMFGVGVRPTVSVDDSYHPYGRFYQDWADYDDHHNGRIADRERDEPTAFFSLPVYAFAKFDFSAGRVAPFLMLRAGSVFEDDIRSCYFEQHEEPSWKYANAGGNIDRVYPSHYTDHAIFANFYGSAALGARIAMRHISLAPFAGYSYNGNNQTAGHHAFNIGMNVEF